MKDIITIFFFISAFMLIIGILYCFLLRNKDLEKRLNYYLDINKKYKEKRNKENQQRNFLKTSNEFIRESLEKGLPGKKQQKIYEMLVSAGSSLRPEEYVALRWFLALIAAGVLYLISGSILILILGAVFGFIFPKLWLKNKRKKRMQKFNDELPDMINTIIGSIKSGYSLPQAMKTVSEENEPPISDEIKVLLKELNYGISMEDALNNLYIRMPSMDLQIMIHAILIQRQVGGNLSSILEILTQTIRERKKVERQVRTFTAQGRLSGKIIGALPIFMGLILYLFNSEYIMDFIKNIIGQILIVIGVLFAIIGYIVINRITKIEV